MPVTVSVPAMRLLSIEEMIHMPAAMAATDPISVSHASCPVGVNGYGCPVVIVRV
jgi:hypothetical protein